MREISRELLKKAESYDRDQLLELVAALLEKLDKAAIEQSARARIDAEMHLAYRELQKKYDDTCEELRQTRELLKKETDKNTLRTRSTFGRKTEKFLDLVREANDPPQEPEDESQDEEVPDVKEERKIVSFEARVNKKGKKKSTGKGYKSRLKESLKDLPHQIVYDIDVDGLNEMYGVGQWDILLWHVHETLEVLDCPYYVKQVRTPVITAKERIVTIPYENPLLDRSHVSVSLLADILYKKFVLGIPFYRQEMDLRTYNIGLARQTIIHWVNTLVPKIMAPVREYLTAQLIKCRYVQNDETFLRVNKDGRAPGNKGYMWVHCSSELLDCHPIIVFYYEATRNTDHLRGIFSEFLGYLICDAYISYQVMEKEAVNGAITVSGCMMHLRRYFAEAFFVNDVASLSDDELKALPETKVLLLIREIYAEEQKMKDMPAKKRAARRQSIVKPKVDTLFEYIHDLSASVTPLSFRLQKAVTYALNQESRLRQFLTDGNIPIDNGHAERVIRSYSVGRANWLFADTPDGAEVNALMYSIVETAKANQVNVRIYLQYLLEKVLPLLPEIKDVDLEELMPWSQSYKSYEEKKQAEQHEAFKRMFPHPSPPKLNQQAVPLQADAGPPVKEAA